MDKSAHGSTSSPRTDLSNAALFISDLHLCPSRPAATDTFLDFLSGPARDAASLTILGDLFEYWAGDDDLDDPFNATICKALAGLGAHGTRLRFIVGNRDFLVGAAFARAAGLTLVPDGDVEDIAGTPTLLLHGDTLCTDDAAYQRFRREVRGERWQKEFLALPRGERKAQIEALRRRSEAEKQHKPMAIMDANPDAIAAAFRKAGCSRMIHGHTHRRAHHFLAVDGANCERWVLGDWYASGNYLHCDGDGCRFVALPFA